MLTLKETAGKEHKFDEYETILNLVRNKATEHELDKVVWARNEVIIALQFG